MPILYNCVSFGVIVVFKKGNMMKILTQKNTLKKTDWSSRVKQTHDELSKIIGVDDSHFISGYFEKKISENDESYVEITISEAKL